MSLEGLAHDRLLPWIAAERGLRAVVLVAVGVVLHSHTHSDWGQASPVQPKTSASILTGQGSCASARRGFGWP